jgi:hypothetical protein
VAFSAHAGDDLFELSIGGIVLEHELLVAESDQVDSGASLGQQPVTIVSSQSSPAPSAIP